MGRIGIYKNLVVSYQEFENALLRLGYHKVMKPHARVYINEEYDSVISIKHYNTLDKMMILGEFSAQAYLMEMKGVLEDMDDIAKMIEQDRLATLEKEQKDSPSKTKITSDTNCRAIESAR